MAANENNVILNIPFDEAENSKKAYDYSGNRHDGTVVDANFTSGKQGNCIKFDGRGFCEIPENIVPLSSNFTLLTWLKRSAFPDGFTGKRIGFVVRWNELQGFREFWFDLNAETWGYWAVVKRGYKFYLYLDTQLVKTFEVPEVPTGFAFVQDIYSTEYGYGCIDEAKIYNVALTQEEITESISSISQLTYYLDGVDFKQWDVYVSESLGLLDRPKLKAPRVIEWDDYHGEVVDLKDKRVQAREITLNCFMHAKGKINFVTKLNNFLNEFGKDGTQRLMVDIHPTKPLVYEVYAESGVAVGKRWNDDVMVGTFSLKLREPEPVKRVVRHQRISEATKTLNITLSSDKAVSIYWGDGSQPEELYGDKVTASHTYPVNGIYYVIVAGVIEDIKEFETNGIIVWNKL